MTHKQLTALCAEWQGRLRLRDWDVAVEFTPRHRIDCDGLTSYNTYLKTADISICSESTAKSGYGYQLHDPEQVLVHELLHLQFPTLGTDKTDPSYVIIEQGIDLTAWALVRAKRGGKK
jgi:hypothetical protein